MIARIWPSKLPAGWSRPHCRRKISPFVVARRQSSAKGHGHFVEFRWRNYERWVTKSVTRDDHMGWLALGYKSRYNFVLRQMYIRLGEVRGMDRSDQRPRSEQVHQCAHISLPQLRFLFHLQWTRNCEVSHTFTAYQETTTPEISRSRSRTRSPLSRPKGKQTCSKRRFYHPDVSRICRAIEAMARLQHKLMHNIVLVGSEHLGAKEINEMLSKRQ